jgi:peptidyl-prolyl cis-trans isomerase B (cyclophilin B)
VLQPRLILAFALLAAFAVPCSACSGAPRRLSISEMKEKVAVIETTYGSIVIEFYPEDAPNHVWNFIKLARSGFYDGLTFHRVVEDKVIQGGCPRGDGFGGPGYRIRAEFNEHEHLPGAVGMAREDHDPDSAGSQFYICLAPMRHLDGQYTVFGHVIDGMDTVRRIGRVPVDALYKPVQAIFMDSVTVRNKEKKPQ